MMKRIAALVFVALGCFVVAYSLQLQMYTNSGPGAGLFPVIIGSGLCLLGILWFLEEGRVMRLQGVGTPTPAESPTAVRLRVALQLAALVLFVVLFPSLGYLVAAAVLTVATAWIAGERNWLWIAAVTLVTGLGVQWLFAALGTTIR